MFIVEYDFILTTINYTKSDERRFYVYDKFEDALAEYRRASNMENMLGEPASKNLKLSKATLTEMDVSKLL